MNHPYNDKRLLTTTDKSHDLVIPIPPKTQVIDNLGKAIGNIKSAYEIGISANPMAADLSVFQELLAINKKLSETMLAINKLRGL